SEAASPGPRAGAAGCFRRGQAHGLPHAIGSQRRSVRARSLRQYDAICAVLPRARCAGHADTQLLSDFGRLRPSLGNRVHSLQASARCRTFPAPPYCSQARGRIGRTVHGITFGMTQTFPLLPLRDIVVFPNMVVPLFVGRDKSVAALEAAMEGDKDIFLLTQLEQRADD